jgi:peptide/nickel transport system permease protein
MFERALGWAPPVAILAFCLLGPLIWAVDPATVSVTDVLQAPSLFHPAGTDGLGRDELARLMQGGAATLMVACPASALACVLGAGYGLAAGLAPRWPDAALMRLLDAILALPSLVLLIAIASLLDLNTATLVLLVTATTWAPLARLVRNEVRALRSRDFIRAAEQVGATPLDLARIHILPNLRPLLRVNLTLMLGDCIALISALGFLGLGVQPPATSWGQLLAEGLGLIDLGAWWLIAPPGLLIAGSLLATAGSLRVRPL